MSQGSDDLLFTCPKCSSVLDRVDVRNVDVDVCPECGGLWLDRGELVKLKLTAAKDLDDLAERMAGDRKVPPTSSKVKLRCPACNGRLTPLEVPEADLDICETCCGLWLDRGELEPALEALGSAADQDLLDALIGFGCGCNPAKA
jgi:Zn-finger nucleic acid-binding protein